MNKKRKDSRTMGGLSSQLSSQTLGDSTSSLNTLAQQQSIASSASNSNNINNNKRSSKRKVNEPSNTSNSIGTAATNGGGSHTFSLASTKKKGSSSGAGLNDLSRLEKMVPTRFPLDHPFNKDGYRYHLVEPDPHSPMRQKFEETELWAGKPLPGHLYRLFLESRVFLSLHDRAPQLKLSEDRLSVHGEKGYSMVRANQGVSHGSWYFEVHVKEKPAGAALRIGWAQKLANLQAPCGYDKFSYSWRSRKGTKFHDSIGKTYSRLLENDSVSGGSYGADDVLGFFIHLPYVDACAQILPGSCKNMTMVKFKNHLYYEEKDYFAAEEKCLVPLKGSRIEFFKNGVSQGLAYSDIYKGVYYPAISLYKNALVHVNFGPDFKYPITDPSYGCKPISNLAEERYVENTLADILFHVVNEENYIKEQQN